MKLNYSKSNGRVIYVDMDTLRIFYLENWPRRRYFPRKVPAIKKRGKGGKDKRVQEIVCNSVQKMGPRDLYFRPLGFLFATKKSEFVHFNQHIACKEKSDIWLKVT